MNKDMTRYPANCQTIQEEDDIKAIENKFFPLPKLQSNS